MALAVEAGAVEFLPLRLLEQRGAQRLLLVKPAPVDVGQPGEEAAAPLEPTFEGGGGDVAPPMVVAAVTEDGGLGRSVPR